MPSKNNDIKPKEGSLKFPWVYRVERPERITPPLAHGEYKIHNASQKQVIMGLGIYIKCDHASDDSVSSENIPLDLFPNERKRLCREMLNGFRYCRLGGGLHFRGLDSEKKTFRSRWPGQLEGLREVIEQSGIEGISFEYWSPAPFWKASGKISGCHPNGDINKADILRCFGDEFSNDPVYAGNIDKFMEDFSSALVSDIQYLEKRGLPVVMWGLQNEPRVNAPYGSCRYMSASDYCRTFVPTATAIRKYNPKIQIIADTWDLSFIKPILANPQESRLVDALVEHNIGADSKDFTLHLEPLLKDNGTPYPFFTNEFEYLYGPASPARCLNTVQNIMNWFQLADSPTWFWHTALEQIQNPDASGYGLGFWRPIDPEYGIDINWKTTEVVANDVQDLPPGHWTWNKYNWYALAGFLKYMPWDSTCIEIEEAVPHDDNRIFAFKHPEGRLVIVISNRCTVDYTFNISLDSESVFTGYRYTPDEAGDNFRGVHCGQAKGPEFSLTLPDMSWEFWLEHDTSQ